MMPGEYNIEGKTVIITGAARGIGKGIARVLAECGAKVMVTALTNRYLKPLSEEMAAAGHPIETITADATKSEDWQRTVELAMDKWGHIDALINNLGDSIRKPLVPLPGTAEREPITDEEWRFVLDVNLTQAFMGCRAVGPHLLSRGAGRVLNISGFAARKGSPEMLVYSAAKAGVGSLRCNGQLHRAWDVPRPRDRRPRAGVELQGGGKVNDPVGPGRRTSGGGPARPVLDFGRVQLHDRRDHLPGWRPHKRVASLLLRHVTWVCCIQMCLPSSLPNRMAHVA